MSDLSSIKRRPWVGVLLSLLVPGFGLIRAGMWRRGFGWMLVFLLMLVLVGGAFSQSWVPLWAAALAMLSGLLVQAWMWYDSYRPGRMSSARWLLFLTLALAIIMLPTPASFVARAFKISTGNMEPTLLGGMNGAEGDHIITDRLSYYWEKPKRGDLLVFSTSQIPGIASTSESDEEVFYITRLVGMPGERIAIKDGKLFANGRLLSEADGIPDLFYTELEGSSSTAVRDGADYVVGDEEYFVLGDNSPSSYDSRMWGGVPASAVYGKATMIYYPLHRVRRF